MMIRVRALRWIAPLALVICSAGPGIENPQAPLGPIGYWRGDDPAAAAPPPPPAPPAPPATPAAPADPSKPAAPAPPPPPPPAPKPASAADASGNNRAGTFVGGSGISPLVPNTKFPNPSSFTFDGVSGQVTIPDTGSGMRVNGDFTVAFWKRKTAPNADWVRIVGKGDGGQRTFGLWEFPGAENRLKFQIYSVAGGSVLELDSNVAIPLNTWAHVIAVVSVNSAALYIDGKPAGNAMRTGEPAGGAHPLTLGHAGYHGFFSGQIDDVRLYNRALSMSEVVYLAAGNGGPDAPAGLAAKSADGRQVVLTWTPSATPAPAGTATIYSVKRSKTAGKDHAPIAGALPATTFTDSQVEPGATYAYVVTAINTGGESVASNEITVTIPK